MLLFSFSLRRRIESYSFQIQFMCGNFVDEIILFLRMNISHFQVSYVEFHTLKFHVLLFHMRKFHMWKVRIPYIGFTCEIICETFVKVNGIYVKYSLLENQLVCC